jgi:long-chain acyl-CoA synthetase
LDNVYQLIENNDPERAALIFMHHRITYGQLKEAVARLAHGFVKAGIQPGDRMALMLANVPHFPISFFALHQIGAIVVPVSVHYKAEEIHHQLEDSEVKGIVYWEGFRSQVRQAAQGLERCHRLFVLGDKIESGETRLTGLMENNEPLHQAASVSPDETAVIVYTGGITGRMLGAELTHRNILSSIESCAQCFRLTPEDKALGLVPYFHPVGQNLVLGAFLKSGASVAVLPILDGDSMLAAIREEQPTHWIGTPHNIQNLLDGPCEKADLKSIRNMLCIGDAMKAETKDAFESRFEIPILEGYGLTEASSLVSFNSPTHERPAGSIGLPLPGVDIKIVDENDVEVRPGQIGEILVQGPNVMKGYSHRPEATKEALRNGWLHTGDLALLSENGFASIVARKKNVILRGGYSVYPREVEMFLLGHPQIADAVVVGLPHPTQGEEIHACVISKPGETPVESDLIAYMKERIAAYKCPSRVHILTALPKGPTGRVMRDSIRRELMQTLKIAQP